MIRVAAISLTTSSSVEASESDAAGTGHVADRAEADRRRERVLARQPLDELRGRIEHAVTAEDLALVRVVDERQLELLAGDVLPHVELGPVRDREDADVLALADPGVVEVPELGPLRARVPLPEVVAEAEDPLLRAGSLLVAPGTAHRRVEAVLAIASSRVVVCSWFRDARGPRSSTTRPWSIDSWTLATIRRSSSSAMRRSRNSITSGKLCPVSTCMTANGKRAGRKAFSARRRSTIESLPPEKRSTGRSRSAATSRMMWIASDSSASRWVRRRTACWVMTSSQRRVQAALDLGRARPAALAPVARLRAMRAADRGVAGVVQRVVGQAALGDVRPDARVVPVGQRVGLPQLVRLVPAELRRSARVGDWSRRRPVIQQSSSCERAGERRDLADRAAEIGLALPERLTVHGGLATERRPLVDLDGDPVALLDLAPDRVRLREEDVRVEREDARVGVERQEHVEQHRLLLLEGAGERDTARELAQHERQDLGRVHRLDGGGLRKRERARRQRAAPPSACRRGGRAGASRAG